MAACQDCKQEGQHLFVHFANKLQVHSHVVVGERRNPGMGLPEIANMQEMYNCASTP